MKNKNFNDNFDKVIILYSSIVSLIVSIVLLFINVNIFYSFNLCFLVSLSIFIKNSVITSNVLYRRLEPVTLWMTVNYITSTLLYIGVILVVVLIDIFHLIGLSGLFIVSIVTIFLGIIHK